MERLWRLVDALMSFLGTIAIVILIASLMFSVGYHLGFTKGVDTKVTLVGERYIMKERGAKR